ncbi:MAG TPA: PQQ-dependent dehydrogenase, methanol/ethanol family [Steroidobacteraceae bacterium]
MRRSMAGVVVGVSLLAACARGPQEPAAGSERAAWVDTQRIVDADKEPGNWMTYGRTYSEQRFSPLTQINDNNVHELGLAWYFDLSTHRGVEATPLVIDGVMYNISAWNITYALDAKTGKELWRYDPQVDRSRGRFACCDVVSRGIAAWKGKIIIATLDGRLIALDARTGKPLWSTQTFDKDWAYTITGAPRVFNGKVIIGNGGSEFGVRGYVTAYDVETGEQVWRFYTVPGDPSKGFESKAMEMAAKTWNGEWWKYGGGGTAWDSIVYDPELNFIYIGTGNSFPWVHEYRSPGGGDNLFLASIVAVHADTGEYVWHYQQAPGEQWDYTATQPMILADLTIDGRERKVLMQAPKNGFFYVLDRQTGELISAEKFVPINLWATHIDMKTGRPVLTKEARYGFEPVLLTPSVAGAHNWHPMAYSPLTGLVYFPAQEHWWVYSKDPNYDPNKPRQMANDSGMGGPMTDKRRKMMETARSREKGWLMAWDPVQKKEVWRVPHERAGSGGVLVTAGNLLFQGNASKQFVAYRADTGEKLWEMDVQTVPMAGPITYTVDGEQYIAVNAGWGGGMAMAELRAGQGMRRSDARVLAFRLGGKATLPPLKDAPPVPFPPVTRVPPEVVAKGEELYEKTCARCHGPRVVGGGVIRDLRHMSPETHKAFNDIVLKGTLVGLGMASFADVLTVEDAEAIHAYINARALEDWGDNTGAAR